MSKGMPSRKKRMRGMRKTRKRGWGGNGSII
jgi:hypothetical protein